MLATKFIESTRATANFIIVKAHSPFLAKVIGIINMLTNNSADHKRLWLIDSSTKNVFKHALDDQPVDDRLASFPGPRRPGNEVNDHPSHHQTLTVHSMPKLQ